MLTYPELPGVEFRPVNGFAQYAVSSDRRVWREQDGKWHEVSPVNQNGRAHVWLKPYDGLDHFVDVQLLVQQVFGGR